MRYPCVIESGDDTHAFGVIFPDCPGCYSAGDTLDEALENAPEALAGWMECMVDEGYPTIHRPLLMKSLKIPNTKVGFLPLLKWILLN